MRATLRAAVTAAIAVSLIWLPAGAGADPVRGVSVNMWGSDTGYTASMVGTLTPWTSTGGTPLAIGGADVTWGVTTGATSLGGSCIIGFAIHVDHDTTSGDVDFDCFALGHAIDVVDRPDGGRTVYQAYLLGNVHVTLHPGAGATIQGLATPFAIGFPNRPGGWGPLWAQQQVVCVGAQPCELGVTT